MAVPADYFSPSTIPLQLRSLPQWLRFAVKNTNHPWKKDKVPLASIDDRDEHKLYDDLGDYPANGIHKGFVFYEEDPFCFIDIDGCRNPITGELSPTAQLLIDEFNSYTEVSVSGRGIHIFIQAKKPGSKCRKDFDENIKLEIYDHKRFVAVTGAHLEGTPPVINPAQKALNEFYNIIFPSETVTNHTGDFDYQEVFSDEQIVDTAKNNSEKFVSLWKGEWQGQLNARGEPFCSQSEADAAIMETLYFYSRNKEQTFRLFLWSGLGSRSKAHRVKGGVYTYLETTFKNMMQYFAPPVELSMKFVPPPEATLSITENPTISFPPGLVGDVAQYSYDSSVRPAKTVALAGALSFISALVARQYNVSKTGCNLYTILLAPTGRGKDDANKAIDRLWGPIARDPRHVADPRYFNFMINDIASGPALTRRLETQPFIFAVLGEFGIKMQMVSDPKAADHLKTLKQRWLDLYSRSGQNSWMQPSIYSDITKNTQPIQAPNLTIFGETNPSLFFPSLTDQQILQGFIGRFLILEYSGDRQYMSEKHGQLPPPELLAKLEILVEAVFTMQTNNSFQEVELTTGAKQLSRQFDAYTTDIINNQNESEVSKELWNRAHMNTLKLAAVVAVGINHHEPVITEDVFQWALDLVKGSIDIIKRKFDSGEIGSFEQQQLIEVRKLFKKYLEKGPNLRDKVATKEMWLKQVIPYSWVHGKVANMTCFREDQRKTREALDRAIKTLVDCGEVEEVPKLQMMELFNGCRARALQIKGN